MSPRGAPPRNFFPNLGVSPLSAPPPLKPPQRLVNRPAQQPQVDITENDEAIRARTGAHAQVRNHAAQYSNRCMLQRMVLTNTAAKQYVISFHFVLSPL